MIEYYIMIELVLNRIVWERVLCHLTFDGEDGCTDFDVALACGGTIIDLPKTVSAGSPSVTFNVSRVDGRAFLPNGLWTLCYRDGEEILPVTASDDIAVTTDNYDRIFRYGGGNLSYTIKFAPFDTGKDSIGIKIDSQFTTVNRHWRKRRFFAEVHGIRNHCRALLYSVAKSALGILYRIASVTSRVRSKKERVLFLNENRSNIYGNLQAVKDCMAAASLDKNYMIKEFSHEHSFRVRGLMHLARATIAVAAADVIFVDNYAPTIAFIPLRANQKVIQLWHSVGGFKSLGYSRFGKEGTPHPSESSHRKYHFAVCGAEGYESVFGEVFGIDQSDVMPLGAPRMDRYTLNGEFDSIRHTFLSAHPYLLNKEIILFAPTFRGRGQAEAYYDFSVLDFDRIAAYCGNDKVFLIKNHPFVTQRPDMSRYGETIIDMSKENLFDIMTAADILITDYSSCYYEFCLRLRPIIFFMHDKVRYIALQGVHQKPDDAPGKVVCTFDELMSVLSNHDYGLEKTKRFRDTHYGVGLGHSSERIIERVFGVEFPLDEPSSLRAASLRA
jgi:CDP-ribitol ribitolphosphotransferase